MASVSWATARAISVLPQPGGPYSSTPFGASMPSRSNTSGYLKRQLDHLADAVQLPPEAADVLVGKGAPGFFAGCLADDQFGRRVDDHRSLGHRAFDGEIRPATAEQRGAHPAVHQDRQAVEQAADVLEIAVGGLNGRRRQHDTGGGPAGDFLDSHDFVEGGPGVLAGQPVDLNARVSRGAPCRPASLCTRWRACR